MEAGGGPGSAGYGVERLDHLGIVAGVCREIGLAEWLDGQDAQSHERGGVGTATVAMILTGLGFSNRRLYLVPQFFANTPLERLLGPGITAEDLNDECLGRALDWLYAHDPTTLFAGIALRARRAFGIRAHQVPVDTTSFAVTGEYVTELEDLDGQTIAVTDGCGGIPEEDLPRVFDMAWRGTHARTPGPDGGAGLGLAIVRGIVEAHAGQITVANIAGGCRFEVSLPALA